MNHINYNAISINYCPYILLNLANTAISPSLSKKAVNLCLILFYLKELKVRRLGCIEISIFDIKRSNKKWSMPIQNVVLF
jgi:hypothetical protein